MPRMSTLVRMLGISGVFGLAALALPLPTHAGGVHVSVGFGRPWPVIVQPAPVVVARPTVVYPAPVIAQAPVVVAAPPEGYAPPAYGTYPCDVHAQRYRRSGRDWHDARYGRYERSRRPHEYRAWHRWE
jgi:hypothetical protein